MSKPNEATTLTPEQILNGIYSCNPFTADIDVEVGEALQKLNTYYLNLFMECLGEEDLVLKISSAHELYSGAVDAGSYRMGFRTAQSIALNTLKNKLGVDKD